MYYEDHYHPNADSDEEMDYDNDCYSESINDDSTIDSHRKKQRKNMEDLKNIDNGYHKIKSTHNDKPVSIEVYTTVNSIGNSIRDGITGAYIKQHRVGSVNELMYYKVVDTSRQYGKNCQGALMFFDSPEQYERHMKCSVSERNKEIWRSRRYSVSLPEETRVLGDTIVK